MKYACIALLMIVFCAAPARAEEAVFPNGIEERMAGTNPVGHPEQPPPPPVAETRSMAYDAPGAISVRTVPAPAPVIIWPLPSPRPIAPITVADIHHAGPEEMAAGAEKLPLPEP